MSRVWVDPVWPRPGDGARTVREAVGDVVGDVVAKATAYRAEIDAEGPAAQRARRILTQHRWLAMSELCRCGKWQPQDTVADPRVQHEHHVAERLAAADLLNGAAS
jgi:hypothetical protein